MHEPLDILDERDPVSAPFVGSLLVHAGVVVFLFFGWFWLNQHRETLGDTNAAGGPAYTVSQLMTDLQNGIWFLARAAAYAPAQFQPQILANASYWYKKFHGSMDGFDQVQAQAK